MFTNILDDPTSCHRFSWFSVKSKTFRIQYKMRENCIEYSSFAHWGKNPQFIQKFTFWNYHFWQNSQFRNLNFHKIHIFETTKWALVLVFLTISFYSRRNHSALGASGSQLESAELWQGRGGVSGQVECGAEIVWQPSGVVPPRLAWSRSSGFAQRLQRYFLGHCGPFASFRNHRT